MNSNPAVINEMTKWIEHPMEFNKSPEHIEIVAEAKLMWITQEIEDCYLLKFTVKGHEQEYIGFTGPITWCFIGIDFSKLSHEELFLRYTGWHLAFCSQDSKPEADELQTLEEVEKKMLKKLEKYQANISIQSKVYLGDDYYYSIKCYLKNTVKKTISEEASIFVGPANDLQYSNSSAILPFFRYLGKMWDPFNI
ncbi:MAG: hypothetical protein JWP12_3198 [Bacteroidetes bacterium]|nr:hypothetical protein [Bacteroidota bacterium]